MPQVLTVKNNTRPEVIMSASDFEDLIDTHLGMDCAKWYHEQITSLTELIEELSLYIDDKYVKEDVEGVLKVNGF